MPPNPRHLLPRCVLVPATAVLLLWVGFAAAADEPRTVRLLTVGNSFSHNAVHYLADLARDSGDTLVLREDTVGGASMELHWNKVLAFEKNPTDKEGRYASGRSLKEELCDGKWDFVTIQQASIKSHDESTYRPFAEKLRDYIKQYAPDATLIIHETWEYRVDDPRFTPTQPKPGEPATQDEMYQGLSGAYRTIARELGLRLIPVGDAFHLVNHDPRWGFHPSAARFDSKSAQPGELPDQTHSLNMGWNWKKQADGRQKLGMDGHHANMAGEYLGACVWYEIFFGKDAVGNSFVPKGLDAEFAKYLRETAHQVVKDARSQSK